METQLRDREGSFPEPQGGSVTDHRTSDGRVEGKQRYVKMMVQGSSAHAIVPADEVADFADGEDYIMEDVWMTEAEYEALPEFEGY